MDFLSKIFMEHILKDEEDKEELLKIANGVTDTIVKDTEEN